MEHHNEQQSFWHDLLTPWRWRRGQWTAAVIFLAGFYLMSCPIVLWCLQEANYPEPAETISGLIYFPIIVFLKTITGPK